ncbi:MAG: hypothetical protein JO028_14855 [Acidobacteriaceae bacterium]|nr:hypothetical protein [Acidobacteriaceae bacterium]
MPIETVAEPDPIANGGTKLFMRTKPPAGLEYTDEDEKGEFLGYVVVASSVPRWMSSEFSEALIEHNDPQKPQADLNLYAQDWFESISFIPAESIKAGQNAADQIIKLNQLFNHPLSTGCSQVTPRTRIQKLGVDEQGALSFTPTDDPPCYAIVSKHADGNMGIAKEITVAPLESRTDFVQSPLHRQRLTDAYSLRTKVILASDIVKRRESTFNAIKAFQHTP